jgi:hypothetical protein
MWEIHHSKLKRLIIFTMVEKNWKLRLLNLQTLISYLDDMNITRSSEKTQNHPKFQIQLRMFFWEGGRGGR